MTETSMTRQFDEILNRYRRSIEENSFPHAILVTGAAASVQKAFAYETVKLLIGADALSSARIDSENHEDLLIVRSESGDIKVDQIEEMSGMLRNKPFVSDRIVVVIEEGERMNEYSQNKLLKSLEEPHPGNVFLILTSKPDRLLQTIRSRCVLCRLPAEAYDTDEKTVANAKTILSGALFGKETFHDTIQTLEPYFSKKTGADSTDSRTLCIELLDAMENFLRDIAVAQRTDTLVWDRDNVQIAAKMKGQKEVAIRGYFPMIEETRSNIERGYNARNCMRSMVLRMKQEAIDDQSSRRRI
jgi:hypothetical protein